MENQRMMVSILGVSISTFEGFQPEGYAVFYDEEHTEIAGIKSVYDMWWAKVNVALKAYLCVNNAYSGSQVSGTAFSAGTSMERIHALRTPKHTPDLILVYLGLNDFGYGVPLFGKTSRMLHKPELAAFSPAYHCMLERLHKQYPHAKIACSTLMRTTYRDHPDWVFPEQRCGTELEAYNEIIRSAVRKHGCMLADTSALDRPYETIDGFHPTVVGHRIIAENWLVCPRQYFGFELASS
ncbi:MAG: hypothetical protein IJ708_04090 [Clostridia bacterium]|nr:hypothetical protein [Clostridia bacterium]